MSQSRKARRRQKYESEKRERVNAGSVDDALVRSAAADTKGFDLRKVRMTDLGKIELDTAEETMVVTMHLPVGDGESFCDYDEVFDTDDGGVPDYVDRALQQFARAVVRMVGERHMVAGDLPCSTCTSACCGRQFQKLRLTDQDIERMEAAEIDCGHDVIEFYARESWSGYVGEFIQVPYEGPNASDGEECCPHLGRDGCQIYEHRPLICREYSAWTCDLHDEDPEKIDGKVHLKVAP